MYYSNFFLHGLLSLKSYFYLSVVNVHIKSLAYLVTTPGPGHYTEGIPSHTGCGVPGSEFLKIHTTGSRSKGLT